MKVTSNNNYGEYLKNRFDNLVYKRPNYFHVGLVGLILLLCFYGGGIRATLKLLAVLINGFAVAMLLSEILTVLFDKEFKRNKIITHILIIGIFTTIIIGYFNIKNLYFSFLTGLAFAIPVILAKFLLKKGNIL